jgi:hypothetical protein
MKAVWAATILFLVIGLASVPTSASCASTMANTTISTAGASVPAERSFIWSAVVFEPFYFETYPPAAYQPPFTSQLKATFWSAGEGDIAYGAGNDSGSRNLVGGDLDFVTNPYVFFGAEFNSDWTSPGIDGCNDMSSCTCLLLSDVDPQDKDGLFALVAAATDTTLGTLLNLSGTDPLGNALPIVLAPMPRPTVTDVVRPQTDTVEITVTVPTRSAGGYEAASGDGCFCGPAEFLIRYQVIDRDQDPTADRLPSSWPVAPLVGGGAQPRTPTDGSVTLEATCPTGDQNVFLVTELFFDSGFSTAFVSGNSVTVECGGNLSGDPLEVIRDPTYDTPQTGGKKR